MALTRVFLVLASMGVALTVTPSAFAQGRPRPLPSGKAAQPGPLQRPQLPGRNLPPITSLPQVNGGARFPGGSQGQAVAAVAHSLYFSDADTGQRMLYGRFVIRYLPSGQIASDDGFAAAYQDLQDQGLSPTFTYSFLRYERAN